MNYIFNLVLTLIFTDTVLYAVIVPLVPVYTQELGLTHFSMGAIYAAYSLGLLLFSIPMGIWAERIGYKKILIFGIGLLSLSCLFYSLVSSAVLLSFCRFLQGVAAAATWTGGLALTAVMFPQRQGEKLGLVLAVMGVGTVMGPPLGGFLYEFLGYRHMFNVLAAFLLLILLLVLKSKFDLPQAQGEPAHGQERLRWNWPLFWLCVVLVWITSSFGMLEIVMPGYLSQRFALDSWEIGLVFGFMGIVHGLGDALMGFWSDRLGYASFVFWGLIASAFSFPLLALAPSLPWLVLGLAFFSLSIAASLTPSQPLLYGIVAQLLSGGNTSSGAGLAYGIFNTCFSLGLFVGPLLGGALNQYFGLLTVMVIYLAVFLANVYVFKTKIMAARPGQQHFSPDYFQKARG